MPVTLRHLLARSEPWHYALAALALVIATALHLSVIAVGIGLPAFGSYALAVVAIAAFAGVGPVIAASLVALALGVILPNATPAPFLGERPWAGAVLFAATSLVAAGIAARADALRTAREDATGALRAAELSRREAVATLEALVRHAPIGFGFFDRDHRYVRLNEPLARINGFDIEAHLGARVSDTLPGLSRQIVPMIAHVFATGETIADHELTGSTPAQPGVERVLLTNFFPVRGARGTVHFVGMTATEITERKRAEARLAASESRWRDIAETLPQLVWAGAADGAPDYFNRRWMEFAGSDAMDAGPAAWTDLVVARDRERAHSLWEESRRAGAPFEIECRLSGVDGRPRWYLCRAMPFAAADGGARRYIGTCTDISDIVAAREALARSRVELETLVAERTAALEAAHDRLRAEMDERAKAEEQLRQAQKMEALGRLTGGVAHDFNNLLTVILGNIETVRRREGERGDPALAELMHQAHDAAQRAALLTRQLLAFSRRQPLDPVPVDVNRLVQGTSELLRRVLGETISIETVLAGGLWLTEVDANQLESVLLNLAVNARDAMPAGGKLTLETANTHLDDSYALHHEEVEPGQYVVICVSDTGTGMTPDVVERAFEPFFTTKPIGLGTGLGLSQVYGFVKQSGGHVKIYSEPGEGTTVKIYLPRLKRAAAEVELPARAAPAPPDPQETILVVDDDPAVLRHAVALLRELGYRVVDAPGVDEALALLAAGERPHLLFTDLSLSGQSTGHDLAQRAQALLPSLKVLFTTGYARNAIVHHGRLDAGAPLLPKPFTRAELAQKVRAALDDGAARTVLLVEDEPLVALAAGEMLSDLGFTPVTCSGGREAFAAYERSPSRFVLAVVDVGLPDISGDVLARRLRPALPVILATGYAARELDAVLSEDGDVRILGKPYSVETLGEALRSLGFVTADEGSRKPPKGGAVRAESGTTRE